RLAGHGRCVRGAGRSPGGWRRVGAPRPAGSFPRAQDLQHGPRARLGGRGAAARARAGRPPLRGVGGPRAREAAALPRLRVGDVRLHQRGAALSHPVRRAGRGDARRAGAGRPAARRPGAGRGASRGDERHQTAALRPDPSAAVMRSDRLTPGPYPTMGGSYLRQLAAGTGELSDTAAGLLRDLLGAKAAAKVTFTDSVGMRAVERAEGAGARAMRSPLPMPQGGKGTEAMARALGMDKPSLLRALRAHDWGASADRFLDGWPLADGDRALVRRLLGAPARHRGGESRLRAEPAPLPLLGTGAQVEQLDQARLALPVRPRRRAGVARARGRPQRADARGG
ncbi:hypothetical protein EMIHUDRAFT_364683, partial [Emiliania huxleyi CCMP1516]|uniref:Uncharacterized protein n=2 Tax=Emiliania huxleyi TaxID=2903 RepID=A0A0D3K852_EMIH1